jgi:hypothetical protein
MFIFLGARTECARRKRRLSSSLAFLAACFYVMYIENVNCIVNIDSLVIYACFSQIEKRKDAEGPSECAVCPVRLPRQQ